MASLKLTCPRRRAVVLNILVAMGWVLPITSANAQDGSLSAAAMYK